MHQNYKIKKKNLKKSAKAELCNAYEWLCNLNTHSTDVQYEAIINAINRSISTDMTFDVALD